MSSKNKHSQTESELENDQPVAEEQNAAAEAVEPEANNDADQVFDALQKELTLAREDVLRAQAEMQNLRRRTERDIENAHKFALEKFVNELLPVVDNLERALQAQEGDRLEGVELTLKTFLDVLKRFDVEPVDPAGEPFNPELHQAMSMVPNPDMENNSVLEVFQKGYTLSGRLVRPAMVVVVKN